MSSASTSALHLRLGLLVAGIFLAGIGVGALLWKHIGTPAGTEPQPPVTAPPAPGSAPVAGTSADKVSAALRKLDTALNLNRSQRQQARAVLQQWWEEAAQKQSLTAVEKVDLIEKHSDPLRALLNETQRTTYEEMLKDLRRQAEAASAAP
jgi:hypothetical protein